MAERQKYRQRETDRENRRETEVRYWKRRRGTETGKRKKQRKTGYVRVDEGEIMRRTESERQRLA